MAFRGPNLEGGVSSARDVSSSAGPGDPTRARGGGFSLRQVLSAGSKAKPSRRNSPMVGEERRRRGEHLHATETHASSPYDRPLAAARVRQGSSGFVRV